jgi:hypothetical protein
MRNQGCSRCCWDSKTAPASDHTKSSTFRFQSSLTLGGSSAMVDLITDGYVQGQLQQTVYTVQMTPNGPGSWWSSSVQRSPRSNALHRKRPNVPKDLAERARKGRKACTPWCASTCRYIPTVPCSSPTNRTTSIFRKGSSSTRRVATTTTTTSGLLEFQFLSVGSSRHHDLVD